MRHPAKRATDVMTSHCNIAGGEEVFKKYGGSGISLSEIPTIFKKYAAQVGSGPLWPFPCISCYKRLFCKFHLIIPTVGLLRINACPEVLHYSKIIHWNHLIWVCSPIGPELVAHFVLTLDKTGHFVIFFKCGNIQNISLHQRILYLLWHIHYIKF